jgi:hypothetical protein
MMSLVTMLGIPLTVAAAEPVRAARQQRERRVPAVRRLLL